jgi:hypothetical protein
MYNIKKHVNTEVHEKVKVDVINEDKQEQIERPWKKGRW